MATVADATARKTAVSGTAANRPMMPGELEAGGQHEEHQRRMDLHGTSVERRTDRVADDQVADADEHQHHHDRTGTHRR